MSARYGFRWTSSYLNSVWYEVHGDGERYGIEVRNRVCDYEKSICNHPERDWERDVVGAIGLVHRTYSPLPISRDVVDAFNEWREGEWRESIARMRAEPERYGEITEEYEASLKPVPVRGAHYVVGIGWVVNTPQDAAD